jgi:streptomycin 3"-adenylyltransferase
LLGFYLHGSLALGCFNPMRSDLDLLACLGEGMAVETKRDVARSLLAHSTAPYPIEISFVRQRDVLPWQFPTPFDYHYSELWRTRVEADLSSGAWRTWNDRPSRRDPDLAAHLTVARARGIALLGPSADQAFPPVPPADYLSAILDDCAVARDRLMAAPIYGVLTLCRVYAYVLDRRIYSKAEAGDWASRLLPAPCANVAHGALSAYRGESGNDQFVSDELAACAAYLDERIQVAARTFVPDAGT